MKIILKFILFALISISIFSCTNQKKLTKEQKYIHNTYVDIKQNVPEAEVTILNDTIKVLFPEHLLFKKSSSEIQESTKPIMSRFAGALKKYNNTKILINGYTDNSGSKELNINLSKKRAESAKNLLENNEISIQRMLIWGHGDSNPIASNNNEEGRIKNRRVEFIILYAVFE